MAQSESPIDTSAEQPQVINAQRAKQGSRGRHILWILIISLALAAAALFGSLAFHQNDIDGQGGQTRSPEGAAQFDTVPGSNSTPPKPVS